MAGILANSVSVTMTAGETAVTKAVTGYVEDEEITLSVSPTGTDYVWSITKPSGSTARSDLSSDTGASVTFTPEADGYWMATCVVDSTTTYRIRIAVSAISQTTTIGAHRFSPIADASVPTPVLGATTYYSSDAGTMVEKRTDGTVRAPTTIAAPGAGQRRIVAFDGSGFVAADHADMATTADASVTTPADGAKIYFSTERGRVVAKTASGTVVQLEPAKVNVMDFGAAATGSGDDSTPILNAALVARTRGAKLYLPRGTYRYTTKLDFRRTGYNSLDWTGFHVEGDKASEDWIDGVTPETVLLWAGSGSDPMMQVTRGNRIEGLTFRVAIGSSTVAGLDWDKGGANEVGTRIHVERCSFWGDYGGAGALSGAMTYGIAIGRSGATNNLEFGTFRNIWAFWQATSAVAILSTTGQSKSHEFQNMQVGDTTNGLEIVTGSCNWNGGGAQGCTTAINCTGAGFVDFSQIRDLNCERNGRFLMRGSTSASAPVLISGGRFSMVTGYPTDGAHISWSAPGLLTVENTVWEDAGAGTEFIIYYGHGSEVGAIATRNNLFLNSTPVRTGAAGAYWTSINDAYLSGVTRVQMKPGMRFGTSDSFGPTTHVGSGDPNGSVTGNIGDEYRNRTGGAGTTLYIKESGEGTNTGWVAK